MQKQQVRRWLGAAVGAVLALAACQGGEPPQPKEVTAGSAGGAPPASAAAPMSAALTDPLLPQAPQEFSPSLGHPRAGETINADFLVEIEVCGQADCHPTVASQWKDSMHRWSSFHNPFYRNVVETFAQDNGRQASRFCGGCHDPALQYSGAMLSEVRPDDRRAHAGITCTTCHGVAEATIQGNTSVAITTEPIPFPVPGDMDSLRAHMKRVGQPALRTDALCASCHVGFMNKASGHEVLVNGVNDFGPWRASAYAGSNASRIDDPVEPQRCVDCHMPTVQGERKSIRSHRFPGGHTTMAAAIDSPDQLDALTALLKRGARVDVLPLDASDARPTLRPDQVRPTPGQPLAFDVVVINEGTGHRFPGGAQDLRDTWVEVHVRDAQGRLLASAGEGQGEEAHEKAHRLRIEMVDLEGKAVEHHRAAHFRSKAWDTAVPTRGARVARYTWTPAAALQPDQLPLQIQARVMHRRLPEGFAQARCEESKTPRGKAFLDNTQRLTGVRPNPCVEQPVVELAAWTTPVGPGAALSDAQPWWRRLYYRGLGLEDVLQERLQEPQRALEDAQQALASAGGGEPRDRARILLELGRVRGRQGRTDDAEALFKQAEALVGPHPAIALARGESTARVWRWKESAAAYRQAADLAPNDERTWRGLAQALGSLGDAEASYEAAQRGLALEPRDPFLLRSQLLAAKRLDPKDPRVKLAHDAFLANERDPQANAIQIACADQSAECWLERLPVHEHALVNATPPAP